MNHFLVSPRLFQVPLASMLNGTNWPRHLLLGTALFAQLVFAPAAWAQCSPLKPGHKIQMLYSKDRNFSVVPVVMNGNYRQLLLHTAGKASQLTSATVADLNLKTYPSPNALFDINGTAINQLTTVFAFLMGPYVARNAHFLVMPDPNGLGAEAAGIIAGDWLSPNDVELDFANNWLTLYSPDHCAGKIPYWRNSGISSVPMRIVGTQVEVQVTLDGHAYAARIDTGALRSTLSKSTADTDFKGENWVNEAPSSATNGGPPPDGRFHTFASLSFGDVAVSSPSLLVQDQMVAKSSSAMSEKMPPIIIGMDILRYLHMYFAVRENKLYVSALPSR